jgi:hypothetical protein
MITGERRSTKREELSLPSLENTGGVSLALLKLDRVDLQGCTVHLVLRIVKLDDF